MWLLGLNDQELVELAGLDYAYYQLTEDEEQDEHIAIAGDWIEEHGGERKWFSYHDLRVH